MNRYRLVAEFAFEESALRDFTDALAEFCRTCHRIGYTVLECRHGPVVETATSGEVGTLAFTPTDADLQDEFMAAAEAGEPIEVAALPEPAPEELTPEPAPINVAFASDEAGEVAFARGLTTRNFQGLKPSSKNGFTVKDVMKAAKRAGK